MPSADKCAAIESGAGRVGRPAKLAHEITYWLQMKRGAANARREN
jgi:hypothetical protein